MAPQTTGGFDVNFFELGGTSWEGAGCTGRLQIELLGDPGVMTRLEILESVGARDEGATFCRKIRECAGRGRAGVPGGGDWV